MYQYLGDIPAGVTFPFFFPAYDSAGASVTISGLAVTDIEIYKGTSVTQRSSDNGYALIDTDGIDIDSTTGIHGFSVDFSDNSDSGFYAAGSFYNLVVNAITVDSQTVRFIYAFRLSAAESVAGTPKSDVSHFGGSAGSFSSGVPAVNATQFSGSSTAADNAETVFATDFATNYSTTTDKWQTEANVLQIEGSDATNQIRDSVVDDATRIDGSALNTAAAAIGSNGSGLTEAGGDGDHLTAINLPDQTMNITGNITGNLSGSVGSVTGNVGGNVVGSIGSLATQAKADVDAEVDEAIENYHLDHLFATAYDPSSKPGAADALLNELVENDGGVARFTANALEEGPSSSGGDATAANQTLILDALEDLQEDVDTLVPGEAVNVTTSGQNISSSEA